MENSPKLWERSKSDHELHDMFQKIIRVNRVHNRLPTFENLDEKPENEKDEFYNFVSIIINPEQDSSVRKMLFTIYEKLDFGILMSYFYRENPEEFGNMNLDTIDKLKRILDQVV